MYRYVIDHRAHITLTIMLQLMALQTAMTEVKAIVASRGDGGHVSAKQLQSHAEAIGGKLESVLAAGFPEGDPVVPDTKTLVETLHEMRIEVSYDTVQHRDVQGQICSACDKPTHTHARTHAHS